VTEHNQLIAYLATLCALVAVFVVALFVGAQYPQVLGKFEAFGLGTITGGLIGVLRIPSQRTVTVDNPPSDPVPVEPGR
jgi:hypothetical protein